MSFQLSPQAVLFDLERRLKEINEEIELVTLNLVEVPEKILGTKFISGCPSCPSREIPTVLNNPEIQEAVDSNLPIQKALFLLREKRTTILRQIPVINADIEAKGITPQLTDPIFENIPVIQAKQNNTLRNALLIGGALLIL